MNVTVVVPTRLGGTRLDRLLESLAHQTLVARTVVVDNAAPEGVEALVARHAFAERLRLEANVGFSRAVNLAAQRTDDDALVLVNDDCVCEPRFVEELVAALDPAAGVVMAAGVLLDAHDPATVDTAGMELDETLLVFDYLNGTPAALVGPETPPPIGPSAAAAAFDRSAFAEAGGFDENLFAYWEDVDLVLRLALAGGRCALAAGARGTHEHSATLGSGSREKNYLTGFGRGYVLRKWSVLGARRAAAVLARELSICAGQLAVDRTSSGVRGRIAGWRAVAESDVAEYPRAVVTGGRRGLGAELRRRWMRRRRARGREAAV